jgi:uncharacterized alkaline shock family protein YloU
VSDVSEPDDDLTQDTTGERLPCGTPVDHLLEQVAEGRPAPVDDHQRGCVHCTAALREFAEIWAPVNELAAEPVTAPAALIAAIRRQVAQLVQDVWYTLQLTDAGNITIAARVVATLARDVAALVPGVRAALGRSTDAVQARHVGRQTQAHRHPRAAVGVLGRTAVVDLALAVQYGNDLHEIGRRVQRRVSETLRRDLDLRSVTVNVTIDDVLPAGPRDRTDGQAS